MTGFRVDPDALREAVADLKKARMRITGVLRKARDIKPAELTAGDQATQAFKDEIQKRATGDVGSLEVFTKELVKKLDAKIESYEETLREYGALDEAASVDQTRANQQA
ncbi:hypothetical protein LZ318_12540 [Saccharopolyspora indica]|uniref:hypothetical protein n=1 Tax=Saccharopolyspora indica TaxID=1229659 RepID=UPI0022EB8C37|nr:hypothetical protein [Saccharopolyspora indica]MDA3643661.1 hypothetical protein [Saccharopolyspora indica]